MLAKANRLVTADDYRQTVRRGRRKTTKHTVIYVLRNEDGCGARFGFIVSKAVGNAVTRNTVRRRLKAICRTLPVGGVDVVIRALPAAKDATWKTLSEEVASVLTTGKG